MLAWLIAVGESLPIDGPNYRRWRTGMLSDALVARGHRVVWWTSNVDHFTKRKITSGSEHVQISPSLELQTLSGCLYSKNVSIRRFVNHIQIAREFRRLADQAERPSVIFSSFPPIEICREAARFGSSQGVPVALDVNDLWPDEMVRRAGRLGWLARIATAPLKSDARRALAAAHSITAISETYLAWGLGMAGRGRRDGDGVFPLGYQASISGRPDLERKLGCKVFVFVGTFVGSIDLACVLDAAKALSGRPDIKFLIVGDGERGPSWRARARDLSNVEFTGWASRDAIAEFCTRAYAGLAAYGAGSLMSLPNKIFEYLAHGLPILSSLGGETRDLIERERCGVTFSAGDPVDLARQIVRLADDPGLREDLAANARRVFRGRFSGDQIYGDLTSHLEHLAAGQYVSAQ